MYLNQLKEEYPLVYQRVKEQTHNPSILTNMSADVNNALIWGGTTEGSDFWNAVYCKNWDLAKKLQPSLFPEIEEGNVKITINGLFK